jgi:hypothetical protein
LAGGGVVVESAGRLNGFGSGLCGVVAWFGCGLARAFVRACVLWSVVRGLSGEGREGVLAGCAVPGVVVVGRGW